MNQDQDDADELELFRQATQGVRPIQVDQADTGKPRVDPAQLQSRRARAVEGKQAIRVDGLSDQFVIDVHPEEELAWAANGVQDGQLRRLKSRQIPFDGSIDLHGMTVDRARELLWEFIDEATRIEVRCVRITHGKAQRKDGRKPILKSHVNIWLRQHPKLLAFTSCLPRHGGTGSVYVLLRREMLEGRDDYCSPASKRSRVSRATMRPSSISSGARWNSKKRHRRLGTSKTTSGGYPAIL